MRHTERVRTPAELAVGKGFNTAEVAHLYGISTGTVLNEIHSGNLEAVDLGSRTRAFWVIPLASLDKWMARRRFTIAGADGAATK